ncbi:MAG: hypothetical protein H5U02_09820 [Clostridia bacterium]|nr:hypothetical protein [Clostridia bacterium]
MEVTQELASIITDREFLRQAIEEAKVTSKKCSLYAEIANDPRVKNLFRDEQKLVDRSVNLMQQHYDRLARKD